MRDRPLKHPWPFPISLLASGELVRNVRAPYPPPKPLKPLPPPDQWVQPELITKD